MKKAATYLVPAAMRCQGEEGKAIRELLTRVGDKWSILVIVVLAGAPQGRARFSELRRTVLGISQRMLSATLRSLERDGFLVREVFAEVPPRVEYELTPLGRSLLEPMSLLVRWVDSHWHSVKQSRASFDLGAGVATPATPSARAPRRAPAVPPRGLRSLVQ